MSCLSQGNTVAGGPRENMKKESNPLKADKVVRSVCPVCPVRDSILISVKGGKIVGIEGDSEHPFSRGHICIKGRKEHEILYHPGRITHPLLKSKAGWQQISWDEALGVVADQLQAVRERYSPLSICGANCGDSPEGLALTIFIRSLGSPNLMNNMDLCAGTGRIADLITIGEGICTYFDAADFRNSKCILLVGTNIAASLPLQWRDATEAIAGGAKLIVVDPKHTECAEKADMWLQIRPGADGALALGMLNVIINEKLYDEQFVSEWCTGFEQLSQRVQQYSPEEVEKITWISAEDIRKAARLFAQTKPACLRANLGVLQHNNSSQAGRSFAILASVTGNIDVPGGNLLARGLKGLKGGREVLKEHQLPRDIEAKQLGARQFPLWSGPDSVTMGVAHNPTVLRAMATDEPYPVKGMLIFGHNPLLTYPDTRKVLEALKSLEFLVVGAYTMSPTAELADVILPRAHPFEMNRLATSVYGHWVSAVERVVEPEEERWDDVRILSQLSKKMKLRKYVSDVFIPWGDVQEFIDDRLSGIGATFESFKKEGVVTIPLTYKKYKENGFRTPSRKVELYSSLLEKHGYDPLPDYQESPKSEVSTPQLAKKYPLTLVTSRKLAHHLSRFPENSWVRNLTPYPQLEIHPETARERGISEGDIVWIETPKGKCRHKAKVTERIHPKVVNGSFGWWFPEKAGSEHGFLEANINVVMSYDPPYDPIVGINSVQGVLCEVVKAEEPDEVEDYTRR